MVSPLILITFASELVNYSSHTESLNVQENQTLITFVSILLRKRRNCNLQGLLRLNAYRILDQFGCKGTDRSSGRTTFFENFIRTILLARGRPVSVFPGPLSNKQDKTCSFLIRPGKTGLQRHLQKCRTKFDPRAIDEATDFNQIFKIYFV